MNPKTPPECPPARDVAVNRRTVRLAKFAGTIAARLDAHPGSADSRRLEDEKKIIALARKTLQRKEPDTWAVNFLTQTIEMHTEQFGFSKAIYDELFRLNEARSQDAPEEPKVSPRPTSIRTASAKPELDRFLAGGGTKKERPAESISRGRVARALKA